MVIPFSAYRMAPKSIIKVESLNKLFERNNNPHTCTYRGKCQTCNSSMNIEISKTSGGYGLLGGVLYESDHEKYVALCNDCYKKFGKKQCCSENCASS